MPILPTCDRNHLKICSPYGASRARATLIQPRRFAKTQPAWNQQRGPLPASHSGASGIAMVSSPFNQEEILSALSIIAAVANENGTMNISSITKVITGDGQAPLAPEPDLNSDHDLPCCCNDHSGPRK